MQNDKSSEKSCLKECSHIFYDTMEHGFVSTVLTLWNVASLAFALTSMAFFDVDELRGKSRRGLLMTVISMFGFAVAIMIGALKTLKSCIDPIIFREKQEEGAIEELEKIEKFAKKFKNKPISLKLSIGLDNKISVNTELNALSLEKWNEVIKNIKKNIRTYEKRCASCVSNKNDMKRFFWEFLESTAFPVINLVQLIVNLSKFPSRWYSAGLMAAAGYYALFVFCIVPGIKKWIPQRNIQALRNLKEFFKNVLAFSQPSSTLTKEDLKEILNMLDDFVVNDFKEESNLIGNKIKIPNSGALESRSANNGMQRLFWENPHRLQSAEIVRVPGRGTEETSRLTDIMVRDEKKKQGISSIDSKEPRPH